MRRLPAACAMGADCLQPAAPDAPRTVVDVSDGHNRRRAADPVVPQLPAEAEAMALCGPPHDRAAWAGQGGRGAECWGEGARQPARLDACTQLAQDCAYTLHWHSTDLNWQAPSTVQAMPRLRCTACSAWHRARGQAGYRGQQHVQCAGSQACLDPGQRHACTSSVRPASASPSTMHHQPLTRVLGLPATRQCKAQAQGHSSHHKAQGLRYGAGRGGRAWSQGRQLLGGVCIPSAGSAPHQARWPKPEAGRVHSWRRSTAAHLQDAVQVEPGPVQLLEAAGGRRKGGRGSVDAGRGGGRWASAAGQRARATSHVVSSKQAWVASCTCQPQQQLLLQGPSGAPLTSGP